MEARGAARCRWAFRPGRWCNRLRADGGAGTESPMLTREPDANPRRDWGPRSGPLVPASDLPSGFQLLDLAALGEDGAVERGAVPSLAEVAQAELEWVMPASRASSSSHGFPQRMRANRRCRGRGSAARREACWPPRPYPSTRQFLDSIAGEHTLRAGGNRGAGEGRRPSKASMASAAHLSCRRWWRPS